MLNGAYRTLYEHLKKYIPTERLIHDDLRLLAFGTDASFYRLIPRLAVKVYNEQEARTVIDSCHTLQIPLTVRAAGTSLSGQAVTDSVLMLVANSEWREYDIAEDGQYITLQPGILGARVNQYLAPYQKRLGPDPASINHAQIGGIVSNNAAGMSSGVQYNSYHTIKDIRLVFPDGSVLDTADAQNIREFRKNNGDLLEAVNRLAEETRRNKKILKKIKQKYSIKNTTGYSVNALVDFEDPVEIIKHLMVGSEGTLAFISRVSFTTIDDPPLKATSLVLFPDIVTGCRSIALLKTCNVATAELMDRAALRAVEDKEEMPAYLRGLGEDVTALLVETRAFEEKKLLRQMEQIKKALKDVPLVRPIEFARDPKEIAGLWQVRKGLFTSVAAEREKGTTVLIEDIAVPYEHLANTLQELRGLFAEYHYDEAIIWGHAFDGNVHFVLTRDFSKEGEVERYEAFINDLVELVLVRHNGSLKAEHGTGRNMAPFVEKEWGSEIYEIMKRIKEIFDPQNLLNPGVLLNEDTRIHLKNLKPLYRAHELIDRCIECGFCENSCVSRDLTLSPRQRIVVYREISHLSHSGEEPHRLAQLRDRFDYYGDQTCATDGLCALSCPVDIDTGLLIKELRSQKISPRAQRIAGWIAQNMDRITAAMRLGLGVVNLFHIILGHQIMSALSGALHKISGKRIPLWTPAMPEGGRAVLPKKVNEENPLKVVYFSTCINRAMGVSKDYDEPIPLNVKTERLLRKAGYEVIYPPNSNRLCCGMAFSSKGYKEVAKQKSEELEQALLQASDNGRYPILVDMSPCLYHMKETLNGRLKLYEPIEFTLKYLTPQLEFRPTDEPVVIFSVCSAKKMGLEDDFLKLAELCSTNVIVNEANCCGFAGDRGFTHPELNAEGLKRLKEQIPAEVKHGYSTSRTCEIGLTQHSGISYQSILYLVDKVTEKK